MIYIHDERLISYTTLGNREKAYQKKTHKRLVQNYQRILPIIANKALDYCRI